MGIIKITTSLILISLFAIALITFAINFAIDNDGSINLADDPDMAEAKAGLEDDIEEFYVDANTSVEAFQKSTISTQTEASEGGTQYKVTFSSSLGMAKRTLTLGYTKIFGSDSGFGIFITALLSILGFIVAAYLYKAWRGNPD